MSGSDRIPSINSLRSTSPLLSLSIRLKIIFNHWVGTWGPRITGAPGTGDPERELVGFEFGLCVFSNSETLSCAEPDRVGKGAPTSLSVSLSCRST